VRERDEPAIILACRIRARHEQRLGDALRIGQPMLGQRAAAVEPADAGELVEREVRDRVLAALAAGRDGRELAGARERGLRAQRPGVEIDHGAVCLARGERPRVAAAGDAADRVERAEVGIAHVVDDERAAAGERVREVPLVERLGREPHRLVRAIDRHADDLGAELGLPPEHLREATELQHHPGHVDAHRRHENTKCVSVAMKSCSIGGPGGRSTGSGSPDRVGRPCAPVGEARLWTSPRWKG